VNEDECVRELLAADREMGTVDQHAMRLASRRRVLIRQLIDDHDWSQHDVARALGISQPRVSQMLTGKKRR
jgi:predicted XRE-type DNA-binding protein